MILPLLLLVALGWVFIQFWGIVLGAVLFFKSRKYEKKYREQPELLSSHTIPEELEGWNGATELEIDEDW